MGKRNEHYQYFVEGDNEKCLINVLKLNSQYIKSGKVAVYNVTHKKIPTTLLRPLKTGTYIVLVYDTDAGNTEILRNNINMLKKQGGIKGVICIPQVKNLEEELVYACNIRDAKEVTHSKTRSDFKRDFIQCTNLEARLQVCDFDIKKFWSRIPNNHFQEFGNDSLKIKCKK